MSELTLRPQVLFVLLPDPHKPHVFLTKSYSLFIRENQMALPSITLIHQLCGKRKPKPQHTKSRGTTAGLPLIIQDSDVSLHVHLLFHIARLCSFSISLTWLLHRSWSDDTYPGSASQKDDFFLHPAKYQRK